MIYDKSLVNDLLRKARETGVVASLDAIAQGSFDEFYQKANKTLNYTECKVLHQAAEQGLQKKSALKRKRLLRVNPQLRQARSLDIQLLEQSESVEASPVIRSHHVVASSNKVETKNDDILFDRDLQYVAAGHVASMFSPAAYLTELYREAVYLHDDDNPYSLKKRRPDLALLILSQDNLDQEVSTLSLSNELLLQGCQDQNSSFISKDKVLEHLATHRLSGSTPYHHAFQTLRHAVRQSKHSAETVLMAVWEIAAKQKTWPAHVGLFANIDPELYSLLSEEISEENVANLFKKNFGTKGSPHSSSEEDNYTSGATASVEDDFYRKLLHTNNLASYYDMPVTLVAQVLSQVLSAIQVTASNTDLYINDKYTELVEFGGKLSVVQIARHRGSWYSQKLYYANLVPLGNKYSLKVKPRWSSGELYIYQSDGKKRVELYVDRSYGASTDREIIVDNVDIKAGGTFYVRRIQFSNSDNSSYITNVEVSFTVTQTLDVRIFLLKLNKILRLSKATGLAPSDIERIILSQNVSMTVDASVIDTLFGAVHYQQRYPVTIEEAVALSGAMISQQGIGSTRSQFDRLFNRQTSDNDVLAPDDKFTIHLEPDNRDNLDWKIALKRAFQVNDVELVAIVGSETLIVSLSNLSQLYFIHLLSRIHHLTVMQMMTLLNILGYKPNIEKLWTPQDKLTLVQTVYQATQWLKAEALTVEQLFLMTTTTFSLQQTPQMMMLVQTLKSLAGNFPDDSDSKALRTAMSPAFTAVLGVNDLNVTENILSWLDTLKTDKQFSCQEFWRASIKPKEEEGGEEANETLSNEMIVFCQRAGQLALVVQWLHLHALEMNLIGCYPKKIMGDNSPCISLTVTALKQITQLRRFLAQCGPFAMEVVMALVNDKLTLRQLANASGEAEENLLQAAAQLTGKSLIKNFDNINAILHTLEIAKALGVSPPVVQSLRQLNYDSNYVHFQPVAASLLSGLNTSAHQRVSEALDEHLSAALSAYYVRHVLPAKEVSWVYTRDELHQYLLIDNQVSSAVKTSKIAQAIASIQLYIDSCLSGLEDNVSQTGRVRPFFADWSRWNKRYSQWAALKQLLYYPENYIDPTQRVGQTVMMDRLLQTLSQGQLNTDSVEDALKSYLTDFEHIANLSVIGAYHDGINTDCGLTYFVGRSQTEPAEYYWRSLNQSQRTEGKFPANAWREWKKIDTVLQPVGGLIRPVIFNTRLYIVWLERRQKSQQEDKSLTAFFDYTFKLAYLRHDETWSSPLSFPLVPNKNLEDYLKVAETKDRTVHDLDLYCAEWPSQDKLIVMLYKKLQGDSKEATDNNVSVQGLFIDNDMSPQEMQDDWFILHAKSICYELSTIKTKRVNKQHELKILVHSLEQSRSRWGSDNLSVADGGQIQQIKVECSPQIKVTLQTSVCFSHDGYEGLQRHQCNVMKHYGKAGDKFILFNKINRNSDHANSEAIIVPVVQLKGNASGNQEDRFLFYTDVNNVQNCKVWVRRKRTLPIVSMTGNYGVIKDNEDQADDYKDYLFMLINEGSPHAYAVDILDPIEIDTTIKPEDVKVTIGIGEEKNNLIFTADKHCPSLPVPSLNKMVYSFEQISFEIPDNLFVNNYAEIPLTFSAIAQDGRFVGSEAFILSIRKEILGVENSMSLHTTPEGVQYLESGCYRTRLNTLFAKKLVAKATGGLDAIYTLKTQQLSEPQLGEGTYTTLALKKYDPKIHGAEKWVELMFYNVFSSGDQYLIYRGELSEYTSKEVKIFLSRLDNAFGNKDNLYLWASYEKGGTHAIRFTRSDPNNPHGWALDKNHNEGTFPGLEGVSGLTDSEEPMDFTGANALYFWELFYYVPMLITRRLLHEQQFDEAARWLKYVYSPSGYRVQGQYEARRWNARPLLENSAWSAILPVELSDPDAVAQHDPMHYKLATFMHQLELLIARGDAAYRLLERDTLVEAMMWYREALHLFGPPIYPSFSQSNWTNLTLQSAAGKKVVAAQSEVFFPEENTRLNDYQQTLTQRLYNLRHNLTIDGQPLFLPLYAKPANPKALQSAQVASDSSGGSELPRAYLSLYRFPVMLERARSLVSQLMQFGSLLNSILERQDAEALSQLLQTQAAALLVSAIELQNKTLEQLAAEKEGLEQQQSGAKQRFEHYQKLYEENVSTLEHGAIAARTAANVVSTGATALHMAAAAADMVPNIFGLAGGGSRWGALFNATAIGSTIASSGLIIGAENTSQYEFYRRRREDWDIQYKTAQAEVKQLAAQLKAHAIRQKAAELQKTYLQTQQAHTQKQLEFLQRKFSNQALYSWLRGRLSAIYYQFYDLALSRCLMSEAAYHYEVHGNPQQPAQFIKPGAWQSAHAGLLCGEALMFNLAHMEDTYLRWDARALEVTRTVCLSEVYANLSENKFTLADTVTDLLKRGKDDVGTKENGLRLEKNELLATVKLSDLKIHNNYPQEMGKIRRIKQISVTLPVLVGPYQDVRAVLHYSGTTAMPRGCQSLAVSHGMNDSGQFQLDFNDGKYLPFEGIPLQDAGVLTLSFPQAKDEQKDLLLSLSDIILHIRYTIRD